MAIEWTQREKSAAERYEFGMSSLLAEYGSVSTYTTETGTRWHWTVHSGAFGTSGIQPTRLDAERAIEAALPILREADARLTEALQDREAVRAVVGANVTAAAVS